MKPVLTGRVLAREVCQMVGGAVMYTFREARRYIQKQPWFFRP